MSEIKRVQYWVQVNPLYDEEWHDLAQASNVADVGHRVDAMRFNPHEKHARYRAIRREIKETVL